MSLKIQFLIGKWGGGRKRHVHTLSLIMSKLCLFTLQCDVCNKTCLVNCYYSFAFLSKIAFRVLPRPNFFYITFFVVNATVVFFVYFSSIVFVCLFLGFKFPNRSQKLICLIFVWFVCVFFFSCLLKLRLFTKENRAKFTGKRCRIFLQCRPKCFKCQCLGVGVSVTELPCFC